MVGIIKINPHIVGIPDFSLCCFSKKTLTVCLIFIFLKKGINIYPNKTEITNPNISANMDFAKINTLSSPNTF